MSERESLFSFRHRRAKAPVSEGLLAETRGVSLSEFPHRLGILESHTESDDLCDAPMDRVALAVESLQAPVTPVGLLGLYVDAVEAFAQAMPFLTKFLVVLHLMPPYLGTLTPPSSLSRIGVSSV